MPSGANRANEHINVSELGEQFKCERLIGADIVRVSVLVRAPRGWVSSQVLFDAITSGLLPPARWVRFGDEINLSPVGGKHLREDWLKSRVGDQRNWVAVHDACERQAKP